LGDGECETPTTSAAWLAGKALRGRAAVLPIVHLNGFRMGGQSLLGAMADEELRAYAAGFGWRSVVVRISVADIGEQQSFHETLVSAAQAVVNNEPTVIFLRCEKGWGGPDAVGGSAIIGTPRTHKTPLTRPHHDPAQLAALHRWLTSYGPDQLFTASGAASGALAEAVHIMRDPLRPRTARVTSLTSRPDKVGHATFADAVDGMLRRHASRGDFLLLSPDELISNRLGHLAHEPWAVEVLGEEVLLGWLAGWTSTSRRALFVSYEAFAPLLTTGLIQLLKQRRLLPEDEKPPSVNLLLTSYGWHNTYTHGDPSLATTMLASGDPAVRVITPADPTRLAVALDDVLGSTGRCNIIVAGKHTVACHPVDTLEQERRRGIAVWPHASDEGEPDLVLVAAGDLPAEVVCAAAPVIRQRLRLRVRVVAVHDLTVLGHPAVWPAALSDAEVRQCFGTTAPVIIASLGHPAAVWGLIEDRLRRPVKIIGWTEPSGPAPQRRLAETAGMDVRGLCAAAARLLTAHDVPWGTSRSRSAGRRSHKVAPVPVDRWPLNGVEA
jgi:xylulose-5-phosphate/fructose-6-phosphate phosphoketolase